MKEFIIKILLLSGLLCLAPGLMARMVQKEKMLILSKQTEQDEQNRLLARARQQRDRAFSLRQKRRLKVIREKVKRLFINHSSGSLLFQCSTIDDWSRYKQAVDRLRKNYIQAIQNIELIKQQSDLQAINRFADQIVKHVRLLDKKILFIALEKLKSVHEKAFKKSKDFVDKTQVFADWLDFFETVETDFVLVGSRYNEIKKNVVDACIEYCEKYIEDQFYGIKRNFKNNFITREQALHKLEQLIGEARIAISYKALKVKLPYIIDYKKVLENTQEKKRL